jgi:hypothetical protein
VFVSKDDRGSRPPPLLWEQHCCLPLSTEADIGELARYRGPDLPSTPSGQLYDRFLGWTG